MRWQNFCVIYRINTILDFVKITVKYLLSGIWVSVSFILWMVERFVIHANKMYAICDSLVSI